jgi:two-component system, NtrC family, sensor kinase
VSRNNYRSVRTTILTCMILVPVIPFILILIIGFYHFKVSLETSTVRNLKRIAADQREIIDSFLKERIADLEFIHASYNFDALRQPEVLSAVFARLQLASNAYTDLGVFDEAGVHVAYRGPYPLTGKVYREESWFKEVLRQGVYISDFFMGFRKSPHFVVAVARDSAQGRWVIRATIDSQTFNTLVGGVEIGRTGEAYIINLDGVLQTTRRSGGNPLENPGDINDPGDTIALGYSKHGVDVLANTFFSKEDYLYAAAPLKGGSWVLFVRQAKTDAYEALRTTIYMTALICLLGGGLIIMVAFYLTNRIVGRMEKIDAEKAQLGQQLISASRLAELGEMAAGFAHEINNPLQIIKSEHALIEALMSDLKENGSLTPSQELTELEESMAQVNLQISRCAKITQAILKFGRHSEPAVQTVDLRDYIPEVIQMIAKRASVNGITVEQEVDENTAPITGDPAQLQQVMINLFNNAMDAILEYRGTSGGALRVVTAMPEDGFVEITVSDNGCGIRPENLSKVFSPFFTTKPVGEGTGLGLSVCYGVIEGMGGTMAVKSDPGAGTVFAIRLPVAKNAEG